MRRIIRKLQKYKFVYLLAFPSLLYIIVFKFVPLFGLQIAFKDFSIRQGIVGSAWNNFENFRYLFSQDNFWRALKNTIVMGALHLAISFPAALIIAVFFSEIRNQRIRRTVQVISTFPHFLSWVLVASLFFNILGNYGLVNNIITSAGGESVAFFSSPERFRWVLVFSYIWKESGWSSIIYFAAICGVDHSLYEAAKLDGAGRWKCIQYVTLPALKNTIIAMMLIQIGNVFTAGFSQIYNFYNATVYSTADVLETYIYRITFSTSNNFGISAAAGLVESVLNVLTLLAAEWMCRRLTDESLFMDLFMVSQDKDE